MMAVKLVLGLIVVFFLVTFAVKNQQDVDVSYYFGYHYNVKLWVALMASFVLGAVVTALGWTVSSIKEKSRNYRLTKKVSKLQKELEDLKQKPLPDEPDVYPSIKEAKAALASPKPAGALPSREASPEKKS